MTEEPEVIRKLLHPTLDYRKGALVELRKNWIIGYREYLWKAIELERNKTHQSDLINLAVEKMKDKSLRKMIRFIENGQLFPQSHKQVILAYVALETEEVREATLKAIKRENPLIIGFFSRMLKGNALGSMEEVKLLSFLEDLLTKSSDKLIYQFAQIIALRRYTSPSFVYTPEFWENYISNPIIAQVLLEVRTEYNLEINKENEKTIQINRHSSFIWKRFDWTKIQETDYSFYDNLLIDSITSNSSDLRKAAIECFSEQIIVKPLTMSDDDNNVINNIWTLIVKNKSEREFVDLQEYNTDELKLFFERNSIENFDEFLMFETHPLNLLNTIVMNMPRSILLDLSRDDPDPRNRNLSYKGLKKNEFWIREKLLIGPDQILIKVIENGLIALKHEIEDNKLVVFELLNFLLNLIKALDEVIQEELEELITHSKIPFLLEELDESSYNVVIRSLFEIFLKMTDTMNISLSDLRPEISSSVIDFMLENIHLEDNLEAMLDLLKSKNYKVKIQLIEKIEIYIVNKSLNKEEKNGILLLYQEGRNNENVQIRSYSRLGLKNFESN